MCLRRCTVGMTPCSGTQPFGRRRCHGSLRLRSPQQRRWFPLRHVTQRPPPLSVTLSTVPQAARQDIVQTCQHRVGTAALWWLITAVPSFRASCTGAHVPVALPGPVTLVTASRTDPRCHRLNTLATACAMSRQYVTAQDLRNRSPRPSAGAVPRGGTVRPQRGLLTALSELSPASVVRSPPRLLPTSHGTLCRTAAVTPPVARLAERHPMAALGQQGLPQPTSIPALSLLHDAPFFRAVTVLLAVSYAQQVLG